MEITDWSQLADIPGLEQYVPEALLRPMTTEDEDAIFKVMTADEDSSASDRKMRDFILNLQQGEDAESPEPQEKRPETQQSTEISQPERQQYKVGHGDVDVSSFADKTTSWQELAVHPEVRERLLGLDMKYPFRTQSEVVKAAKSEASIILSAPTSAGKTIAFSLAMLRAVDPSIPEAQALCVANTQELATQIYETVRQLSPSSVRVMLATKETVRQGLVRPGFHIVVGTMGTIYNHMCSAGAFDHFETRCLVVDEADKTLGLTYNATTEKMEPQEEMTRRFIEATKRFKQKIVSSATISLGSEAQESYWKNYVRVYEQFVEEDGCLSRMIKINSLVIVDLSNKIQAYSLKPQFMSVLEVQGEQAKMNIIPELFHQLPDSRKSMVFVNSRRGVEKVYKRLKQINVNLPVDYTHGQREERAAAMRKFRGLAADDTTDILISTDLTSRGIDVLTATMVINYEMPVNENREFDHDTLVHRLGRVGRLGQAGLAITIVDTTNEFEMQALQYVESLLGEKIRRIDKMNMEEELFSIFRSANVHARKMRETMKKETKTSIETARPTIEQYGDELGDEDDW